MSDSGGDFGDPKTELRQRIKTEDEEIEKTEFSDGKEVEDVLIDNESCEINSENAKVDVPTDIDKDYEEPTVTVCRGIRNLQPLQRPSFLSRQFNSVKNFFAEFIEFILLL